METMSLIALATQPFLPINLAISPLGAQTTIEVLFFVLSSVISLINKYLVNSM